MTKLTVNGEAIVGDDFVEIVKYGLLIRSINEDVSIDATFEKGVYLSLKYGENIKSAYVVGTKDGESRSFYDGDLIPADYFTDYSQIIPGIKDKEPYLPGGVEDSKLPINTVPTLPPLISPLFGTTFVLVVETYPDEDGYTYVPDNVTTYTAADKCKFEKKIAIKNNDGLKEIDVGSATKTLIEPVDVTYTVGSYVEDHYISSDINAKEGDKFGATFDAGQVVYVFIKKPADTVAYRHSVSSSYESIGNRWYRIAICVSADNPDLGSFVVNRGMQKYTVTWKNDDGSVIYTEECRCGSTPVFNNKNAEIKEYPTKPDYELYTYVFLGWDKEISRVTSDVTYTARYESVLKEYTVSVEPAENGKITPDGDNRITPLDKHTYIFMPDEGYKVKDVIINGVSMGAISSYTFVDVSCDQTLRVEFEKIKHKISVIPGENGSASITGTVEVDYGESLSVSFKPKLGYKVSDIIIDGISIGRAENYTFVSVHRDHTISVEYKPDVVMIVMFSALAVLFTVNIIFAVLLTNKVNENKYLTYKVGRLRRNIAEASERTKK